MRVRNGLNAVGLAASFGVACVLGLEAVTNAGGGAASTAGAVIATAALVMLVRALNGGLYLTPDQLVVRNLGRTYRLSWGQVATIGRGRVDHYNGSVSCLVVHPRQGRPIPAKATAEYLSRTLDRRLRAVAVYAREVPAAAHAVAHVPYG